MKSQAHVVGGIARAINVHLVMHTAHRPPAVIRAVVHSIRSPLHVAWMEPIRILILEHRTVHVARRVLPHLVVVYVVVILVEHAMVLLGCVHVRVDGAGMRVKPRLL